MARPAQMKTRTLSFGALGLLLAVACMPLPAVAHSHKKKSLEIVHPWTPAMLDPATRNVPVYMKLKNSARSRDRLLRASTPDGDKVELIEMKTVGGTRLPMPAAAFDVPPGATELLPDGRRLLVSGIKRRLGTYDRFPMTLVFEKAGTIDVEVEVEEPSATEPHKH